MKRLLAVLISVAMCGAAFAGCGNNADSSKAESKAEASSSQAEKMPETDEEWTQAMYDKAMVSYGNTSMMQNVIKKAQSGEKVTVAYLGGSITEGISAGADGCYAKLTYDYFAQKFGTGDNVQYVNAGLSGTPSKLGILRLDRDVLAYEPDICFIEFAVNDGTEADYQNAYESIVRTLLQKNITPVLLFSVAENDHSAQDYMKQIGEFYHLPMISYCDALRYLFANNRMTWKDFSDDQSHPNTEGHKLVASMVDYYFDTVMDVAPEGDYVMPTDTVFSPREVDAHMYEGDSLTPTSLGSWKEGSTIASFTNGWTYDNTGDNSPIVFEFKDKKFLYMIYKEVKQGEFGKLHVKVTADGEVYEDDYMFAAVSNSLSVAGVLSLSPEQVNMSDGLLEVMLIKNPKTPAELSQLAWALTMQQYNCEPIIQLISAETIEIELSDSVDWTLDGEFSKGVEKAVIKNMHNAITVIK